MCMHKEAFAVTKVLGGYLVQIQQRLLRIVACIYLKKGGEPGAVHHPAFMKNFGTLVLLMYIHSITHKCEQDVSKI